MPSSDKRKRWQFNVRQLLAATTTVALVASLPKSWQLLIVAAVFLALYVVPLSYVSVYLAAVISRLIGSRHRSLIRILVTVIVLFSAYPACWVPTKMWGERHLQKSFERRWFLPIGVRMPNTNLGVSARLPLLLRSKTFRRSGDGTVHRYYFWYFGIIVELPFERPALPHENS